MPTTFVNTIDETEILAKRSQCDYAGNDIQTTYATKSELPTTTSDLTNDSDFITSSDIPVKDVQVGGESVVNAQGIAEISIPQTGVLDVEVDGSSVVNAQGVAEITLPTFTQVNADWDASSGVQEILHKPDLSIYAETANLATVATTGDFDDLVNKPTIPEAQVNSDWNSNSGVSQILNKPTLSTVATTGDYDDLINKPSIPAAQVNADWNSSSGVSEILNKPSLAAVATSGDYADLSGTPTINNVPAVTSSDDNKVLKASYTGGVGSYSWENETGTTYSAGTGIDIDQNNAISVENPLPASTSAEAGKYLKVDANGDPTWATGGGGGGGVNADWDETDPLEPSYIENKPTPKTLTAGANISISEGVGTLTISAAAGLPASTSADEGKCLVVDSNGDPEWGTGGKTYTGTDGVVVDNVNDTVGLEAPVDLVGGPGITVDNPDGNTVRISYSGYNETLLWSSSTAASSFTLSEIITNFERLKILMQYNGMKSWCDGTIVSAAQFTVACCGYANNSGDGNRLQVFGGSFTSSDGKSFASEAGKCIYFSNDNAAIGGGATSACTFLKIYGVNRIANN